MTVERPNFIVEQPRLFEVEDQKVVEVTWVVFVKHDLSDNRLYFLLSERLEDGKYTFPGGKIEEEDKENSLNPMEIALRRALLEVEQETGMLINPNRLIEAGSQPILFREGRQNIRAYPYFAFFDEAVDAETKPETKEPEKHEGWEWTSYSRLQRLILEGKLPKEVLNGWWMEEVLDRIAETIYESSEEGKNMLYGMKPARYMDECENIAHYVGSRRLRQELLR
ncbi:NUDIX hydrolase [Candidatus Woesebacteria bacterium]|nr:NUDIX hydrolase [Candidatus Woesebacteria bacterium]